MFNPENEMCGGKKTILPATRSVFIKLRFNNIDSYFHKEIFSSKYCSSFSKRHFPKCLISQEALSQIYDFPSGSFF